MSEALQSIWYDAASGLVRIIDQRYLPHRLTIEGVRSADQMARAIREMHLRGAPLIGVAAGYGIYLACREALEHPSGDTVFDLGKAARLLKSSRPTAVNLAWAVDRQLAALETLQGPEERLERSLQVARQIEAEEIERCRLIGQHGLPIIEELYQKKQEFSGGGTAFQHTVHILTHCNAGWLACVRHGTATAPIYAAFEKRIPLHVWVDETRPRNQGARLTAWELGQRGVAHTVIADNAGGYLMQQGLVDLVLVGSDRTTRRGDVANKIGTYLKALAAHDNGIPFYVALPSSTIDWSMADGLEEIPIEQRSGDEVRYVYGWDGTEMRRVQVPPADSPVANYAFDITPARLVSGLITERGLCPATEQGIMSLFPAEYGG